MKQIVLLVLFVSVLFSFEVQRPKVYQDDMNIDGWLMSEKLDGIRGYWNGKELFSKNGNRLYAPKWFTKDLPSFELDGELWSKRDDFEFIQSTVLDKTPSSNWKYITYNIFEAPNQEGDFKNRLQKVKKWFDKNPLDHVKLIEQKVCKNTDHLLRYLDEVVKLGGEGVIVKDPKKAYHTGRSSHILKVKKALDMEGVIIFHNLRDNGSLKSLQVKLTNGVVFNLGGGFSEEQRKTPPKIGKKITFKYYGLTKNGKPKFASFIRVRELE